jgi:hypothetical protein
MNRIDRRALAELFQAMAAVTARPVERGRLDRRFARH